MGRPMLRDDRLRRSPQHEAEKVSTSSRRNCMSLLSIVAGACGQLNLVTPPAVVGSTDQQTLQLLALARQGGKELARRFDWQVLTKEATFSTAAAEQQATLS